VVISPLVPEEASLPACFAAPSACSRCGAYFPAGHAPAAGEWPCAFCGERNAAAPHPVPAHDTVDYVTPPGEAPAAGAPVRVLAFDLASPQAELDALAAAAQRALDTAPDEALVALVAFGRAAAVFRLGGRGAGGAVHLDVAQRGDAAAGVDAAVHAAPLGRCRPQLRAALESLRCQVEGPTVLASLADAVDVAAALALARDVAAADLATQPAGQDMERARAAPGAHLVLLSAASDLGAPSPDADPEEEAPEDAAAEAAAFLEDVAAGAVANGVVVDALTAGPAGLAAKLSVLVQGTGGLALAHRGAASGLPTTLAAALVRGAGMCCGLEVRCGAGLAVAAALGHLSPLCLGGEPSDEWREANDGAAPPRRMRDRQTWHYVASAPEAGQAATLLLEGGAAPASARHVYLQVALSWARPDGAAVRRVATKRLRVAADADDAAAALDAGAAAVVLAKTIAAEALHRGAAGGRAQAEILRRGLARRLRDFAERHGEPDDSSSGWISGPSRHFLPRGAMPLAQAAYALTHGPLLGRRLGAPGAAAAREARLAQLLTAQLAAAWRLARPALYVMLPPARRAAGAPGALDALAGPALELQRVPAFDLALMLSEAAVVDAGTALYVWLGAGAEARPRVADACAHLAARLAAGRCPAPDVVEVRRGGADEAEALAWLCPLAGDPPRRRALQLPLLSAFGDEAEAAAEACRLARGGEGEDEDEAPSLLAWLRALDVLPPPPSG
jgi:hypothetical protein